MRLAAAPRERAQGAPAACAGGSRRRLRRSGGGDLRRPRNGAAPAAVGLSGCGARGGGPRAGAGRPGGVRGRRSVRPRWRGGDSAAAAPKSLGEGTGREREIAIELTVAQFEAEDGRERVVDVRGEARGGAPVSGNDGRRSGGSIRPNNGLIGVGAVQRECGAKRGRLWREENGAGWRGTAGAELGGGSARFCPLELDLASRRRMGNGTGSFEASTRIRAPTLRSGAIADAWTRSPATTAAVWASGHSVEHRRGTVCFNDFSLSLTS